VIRQGFAFYQTLHADGRTPFYLLSVIAENQSAQRLLTAGLPQFPTLRPYTRLNTFAIYTARTKPAVPLPAGTQIVRGTAALLPDMVACLQRYGARHQFTPVWNTATLCQPASTPDLKPEDFFVALRGSQVIGCLARWDQRRVKQTVVRGYSKLLARWRWWMNASAALGYWPRLPPINTPIQHSFASHLAVDDDDPLIFAALLRLVYNQAVEEGASYMTIGFSAQHPFGAVIQRSYRHLVYASDLYLATWGENLAELDAVDKRLPGLEIAVL